MRTKSFINQALTVIMATMLLMVAGGNLCSVDKFTAQNVEILKPTQEQSKNSLPEKSDAKISPVALDAVITPASSFDFNQYAYLFPEPVWHVLTDTIQVKVYAELPIYLVTVFFRIFGCEIVTNAP